MMLILNTEMVNLSFQRSGAKLAKLFGLSLFWAKGLVVMAKNYYELKIVFKDLYFGKCN
jgi:hypothetical protein